MQPPDAEETPAPGSLRRFLVRLPALLSLLTLAAHFFRQGAFPLVMLVLAVPFLLFVPRPWAARVVQLSLSLGALSWILTASGLIEERLLRHQPYLRMVVILGGVTLFTLFSALLLEAPALRRWRNATRPPQPPPAEPDHRRDVG